MHTLPYGTQSLQTDLSTLGSKTSGVQHVMLSMDSWQLQRLAQAAHVVTQQTGSGYMKHRGACVRCHDRVTTCCSYPV